MKEFNHAATMTQADFRFSRGPETNVSGSGSPQASPDYSAFSANHLRTLAAPSTTATCSAGDEFHVANSPTPPRRSRPCMTTHGRKSVEWPRSISKLTSKLGLYATYTAGSIGKFSRYNQPSIIFVHDQGNASLCPLNKIIIDVNSFGVPRFLRAARPLPIRQREMPSPKPKKMTAH